jgi:hypothetical protein
MEFARDPGRDAPAIRDAGNQGDLTIEKSHGVE